MQQWRNRVSVVIITRNEERHIADCIKACKPITDHIVVVDSGSSDKTREIASTCSASVLRKDWEGYGSARNYGAENAVTDWILNVDADERPDEVMINSLLNIDLNKNTLYGFRRLNYVGEQPILHGEWNPDYKKRLYNKLVTKWDDKAVHEGLKRERWHEAKTLPGILHHYTYADFQEMDERLDEYAKLGAKDLFKSGARLGLLSRLKPGFRYFKSYYLQGGFKDGAAGKKIAQANAVSVKKKYTYLKELLKE